MGSFEGLLSRDHPPGLGFRACFGAHTRTMQARHMVRGLMSETSLMGLFRGLGFRV